MIIENFHRQVLAPYEQAFGQFFDDKTGAVLEPRREDGTPPFLFTEVTGYALLDCLTLHALTGKDLYIERANRAAGWIRAVAQAQARCGGVCTRYYFERDEDPELAGSSFAGRRIYAFDTSICLRGMINLYCFTGDPAQLKSAIEMGDFIVNHLTNDQGEVTAIFDAISDRPVEADLAVWSRRFSGHHTKCAEALIDLYKSTSNDKYKKKAIAICKAAKDHFQKEENDGAIETSPGKTELHPHCYAAEGFLHVGMMTGDEELIEAARRATEWALGQCREDGEIPQSVDLSTGESLARFRTDSLAQVLALASDLTRMNKLTGYDRTIDTLARKVLTQRTDPGGYYSYGYYEHEIHGKYRSNTKSYWTQMFCLRGLTRYYKLYLIKRTSVIVLAGGIGSRLWPISCENRPKPVSMSLLGDHSLLQETVRRYTSNQFMPPKNVYILCSRNARAEAKRQAAMEGVPHKNHIIEEMPRGTLPAVSIALDGLPPQTGREDRFVIISMGDNVIEPYRSFQNAVFVALITAEENDCIVSIGKFTEKTAEIDERFGYHFCRSSVEGYRAFQVDHFVEKPKANRQKDINAWAGQIAWDCGTVVFKESVFRMHVPPNPESGNLAEDVLAKAAPWTKQGERTVKLATLPLDRRIRFEDFGVPGRNIQRFYSGHPKFDFGNGNICIGRTGRVKILGSRGCLVIADELPIRLYGVRDLVVVDSAETNTSIVLPIDQIDNLPALYRLFEGSSAYEAFIAGGDAAMTAKPKHLVENSPSTRTASEKGMVFGYELKDRMTIKRTPKGLVVFNLDYANMTAHDFEVLAGKHDDDPRLVDQMINVGVVARSLLGDDIHVSDRSKEILDKLCLYHVYGGVLTESGERRETELREQFRCVSGLDRRLLDTRVVQAMLGESATARLDRDRINANVSSAVAFIEHSQIPSGSFRDAVVGVIQSQSDPNRLAAVMANLRSEVSSDKASEFDTIVIVFKLAQKLVNGRCLWKRQRTRGVGNRHQGFLIHDRGILEELPFVLKFAASWISNAGLNPRSLLNRANKLLNDKQSLLCQQLDRLQGGYPLLICDAVYLRLLRNSNNALLADDIKIMLQSNYSQLVEQAENSFQLRQLMELPHTLTALRAYCDSLSEDGVKTVRKAVVGFYHDHWQVLENKVEPNLVSRLANIC